MYVGGGGEEVLYVFSKYNLNIITENQEKKKILHTRKSSHVLLLQSVPKTFWQARLNSIFEEFFLFDEANFMQFLLARTNFY